MAKCFTCSKPRTASAPYLGGRPNCNFIDCVAGMGLAGMEICFLRGEPKNPDCPKFLDENEFIEQKRPPELWGLGGGCSGD